MNILAIGTCCVDVYPQKDVVTPGGEALNISAQLSTRDDVDVYIMALIGNDQYSDKILQYTEKLNINQDHLYQSEGRTANHVIQINKQGDRYFEEGSWDGGVSSELLLKTQDKSLLSQMDAVITTLWEPNLNTLIELKDNNNYLLAVDFNEQRDFTPWMNQLKNIDIVFSSAEESMKENFLEQSKLSETIFVLTFGENGSVAYHHGQPYECPAIHLKNIIDTTGCGDCYQGHFVAEYLKTKNINLAMQRATKEAAEVTTYIGGFQLN